MPSESKDLKSEVRKKLRESERENVREESLLENGL